MTLDKEWKFAERLVELRSARQRVFQSSDAKRESGTRSHDDKMS